MASSSSQAAGGERRQRSPIRALMVALTDSKTATSEIQADAGRCFTGRATGHGMAIVQAVHRKRIERDAENRRLKAQLNTLRDTIAETMIANANNGGLLIVPNTLPDVPMETAHPESIPAPSLVDELIGQVQALREGLRAEQESRKRLEQDVTGLNAALCDCRALIEGSTAQAKPAQSCGHENVLAELQAARDQIREQRMYIEFQRRKYAELAALSSTAAQTQAARDNV